MAHRKALLEVGRRFGQTGINQLLRPFSTMAAQAPAAVESSVKVSSVYKSSPRHDIAAFFTCNKCNTRSAKTFSKESYEQGVVIVRCGGCQNLHLLADRMGMFGDKGSVEDFLAEKGEMVKRASEDTYEFCLEDFTGKKAD